MQVRFHRNFKKRYKKLPIKVQQQFDNRLALFIKDPFDVILDNHPLHGKYKGLQSVNVTGDFRAIFCEEKKDSFLFVDIDTHGNLYR